MKEPTPMTPDERASINEFFVTQGEAIPGEPFDLDAALRADHRAFSDPGAFTPRGENYGEALGLWQERARGIALAPHRKALASVLAEIERLKEEVKAGKNWNALIEFQVLNLQSIVKNDDNAKESLKAEATERQARIDALEAEVARLRAAARLALTEIRNYRIEMAALTLSSALLVEGNKS